MEDNCLKRETESKATGNNQNDPLVSEYNIGHTTYIVELHFNFDRGETLDDVIRRLMLKDAGAA